MKILTEDELIEKIEHLKTVNDLPLGKLQGIMIVVNENGNWIIKSYENVEIAQISKTVTITFDGEDKKPIRLKIKENIVRDPLGKEIFNKDAKVWSRFRVKNEKKETLKPL